MRLGFFLPRGRNFFSSEGVKRLVRLEKNYVSLRTAAHELLMELKGLVVQLVRIHACHAWGREFESRPDRQQRFEKPCRSMTYRVFCWAGSYVVACVCVVAIQRTITLRRARMKQVGGVFPYGALLVEVDWIGAHFAWGSSSFCPSPKGLCDVKSVKGCCAP